MANISVKVKSVAYSMLGYTALPAFSRRQTLCAEEPMNGTMTNAELHRAPIYDTVSEVPTLSLTPGPLQGEVGQARRRLQASLGTFERHLQKGVHTWIGLESQVEANLKPVLGTEEGRSSGALYVTVSTLAGSIIARNRNFLVRLTVPTVFFGCALLHFVPSTAGQLALRLRSALYKQPISGSPGAQSVSLTGTSAV